MEEKERHELKATTIERALMWGKKAAQDVAILACRRKSDLPRSLIRKFLESNDIAMQTAGFAACMHANELPTSLLLRVAIRRMTESGHKPDSSLERLYEQVGETLRKRWLSVTDMGRLMESKDARLRCLAMRMAGGKSGDVYNMFIVDGLNDSHPKVATWAARAAENHWFPRGVIDAWRQSRNSYRRLAAMYAMVADAELPFRWIEAGILDPVPEIRRAAVKAAVGRSIPRRVLQRWLERPVNDEQVLAVIAGFERQIGWNPKWRGEKSARKWLRFLRTATQAENAQIARTAVKAYGLENLVPVGSDIPRGEVYKKCLGGVTVIARIPRLAHCRMFGSEDGEARRGRASHAEILAVEGDFYGEKVGVSWYDHATLYRANDRVIVRDFDITEREDTSGFHFTCY